MKWLAVMCSPPSTTYDDKGYAVIGGRRLNNAQGKVYVADAGANAIFLVGDNGSTLKATTVLITRRGRASFVDGRELDSIEGYHGRTLEVHTDVAVARAAQDALAQAADRLVHHLQNHALLDVLGRDHGRRPER